MKRALFGCITLMLAILACGRSTPTPTPTPSTNPIPPLPDGDLSRTLVHDQIDRSYILHVPVNLDSTQAVPLVLVFHGGGGNAQNAIRMTSFSDLADKEGFLVAYPNGIGRLEDKILTWNGGDCCGYAHESGADDVGFVRALLADIKSIARIDEKRIFATGMSNGAIMSYRLACDMSEVFAAIGPVAGTQNYPECTPSQPVSVIHFHGTDDLHLPYTGGVGEESLTGVDYVSVMDSVTFWARQDGCGINPYAEDTSYGRHLDFSVCTNETAVELHTINGGKHAWPGSRGPGWLGGDLPSPEPDATAVMWDFFKAHPKQ